MSLTIEEVERVEAEAAALTSDPELIAEAVTRMEAIAAAGEAVDASVEARYTLALWRQQGAVIERIEPNGIVLTQADPYDGVGE